MRTLALSHKNFFPRHHQEKERLFHHVQKVKTIAEEPKLDRDALQEELKKLEKKMQKMLTFERKLLKQETTDVAHLEDQLHSMRVKLSLSDSKSLKKRLDRILFLLGELNARTHTYVQSRRLHSERVAQLEKKIRSIPSRKQMKKYEHLLSSLEKRHTQLKKKRGISKERLQKFEERLKVLREKLAAKKGRKLEENFGPVPRPKLFYSRREKIVSPTLPHAKNVRHRILFPHADESFNPGRAAPVQQLRKHESLPSVSLKEREDSRMVLAPKSSEDFPSIVSVREKRHFEPRKELSDVPPVFVRGAKHNKTKVFVPRHEPILPDATVILEKESKRRVIHHPSGPGVFTVRSKKSRSRHFQVEHKLPEHHEKHEEPLFHRPERRHFEAPIKKEKEPVVHDNEEPVFHDKEEPEFRDEAKEIPSEDVPSPPRHYIDETDIEAELAKMEAEIESEYHPPPRRKKGLFRKRS